MSIDYKILFKGQVPEEVETSLGEFVATTMNEGEKYIFTHAENEGNLHFTKVDWSKLSSPPFAYIDTSILKSEVAQMILRRAAGNVGGLNIDDLKDDLIEKSFTVKVLNDYSIGHISDIVLNFALEREVNPTLIRPYVLNLLSFLSDFKRAGIISFPVELDCGFSEDTFFIQAHCNDQGFSFDNILDSINANEIGSYGEQFRDFTKYSDLTDLFKIDSTRKIVITACWFYDKVWSDKKREFSSLVIHDIPKLLKDRNELDNSVNSFLAQSLENVARIKKREAVLPAKYLAEEGEKIREAVNPVKVKNVYDFLQSKMSLTVGEEFGLKDLEQLLIENPRPGHSSKLNGTEKEELVSIIKDTEAHNKLSDDIQRVKGKIENEDYVAQMIRNVSKMSAQDVKQIIKGEREDLGEEVSIVQGSHAGPDDFSQKISGTFEDLGSGSLTFKSLGSDSEAEAKQKQIKERVIESNSNEENSNWEVKKLNVVKKMQEELVNVKGLPQEQMNDKVERIIASELDVEDAQSKTVVSHFSDNVVEDWVEEGVEGLNNEILSRLKLDKVEQQLATRERQVDKMKELITKLKVENGNLNVKVRDMQKDLKVQDFHSRREEEQSSDGGNPISLEEVGNKIASNHEHPIDVIELKNENEKLLSQIESLKKRVNFMYENSKANAGTNLDTNDIQMMSDENSRMKKLIAEHRAEVDQYKAEKREAEVLLEAKKREVEERNEAIAKLKNELASSDSKDYEKQINALKDEISSLTQESKDSQLKAKSFEQKLKYVNVQLDRYKIQEKKKSQIQTPSNVMDAKTKTKIKKLEMGAERMKKAYDKTQKDLTEKKTELHKATLENKTLNVKVRELERKLDVLGRKAS